VPAARPRGAAVTAGAGRGPVRVLLLTPNFDNNSLGRTYCLWLLARHLGWSCTIAGVRGDRLWAPLSEDHFATHCVLPRPGSSLRQREAAIEPLARQADVVIAVKPLPSSFGVGSRLHARTGTPLLLDVDDPDLEVRTTWLPLLEQLGRRVVTSRYRELLRLRAAARHATVLVSNPALQEMYGGQLVPHVRPAGQVAAPAPSGGGVVVRFVGSVRAHKGVEHLRAAVATVADAGVRLEVTAPPPADAHPWERWLGTTTLAQGTDLVATADVVALPSTAGSWSTAQLPVKLIDGMVAGRAIVASDLPPVRWALGGAGLLVPPGDVEALSGALRTLQDPSRRAELGRLARERALERFTVAAVAPTFERAVRRLVADRPTPTPPHGAGKLSPR